MPALFDPNTNTAVSDSAKIVRYLEATYPGTPRLILPETDALQAAFNYAFESLVVGTLEVIMTPPTNAQFNPPSEAFFRKSREVRTGKKLEDWSPKGSALRKEQFVQLEAGLEKLASFYVKDSPFVMGDRISYSDFTIAGWMVWVRRVFGPESNDWKTIASWQDGKWEKLLQAVKKYEVVI